MRVLLPCGLEPLSVVGGDEEISEKCEIEREKHRGGSGGGRCICVKRVVKKGVRRREGREKRCEG